MKNVGRTDIVPRQRPIMPPREEEQPQTILPTKPRTACIFPVPAHAAVIFFMMEQVMANVVTTRLRNENQEQQLALQHIRTGVSNLHNHNHNNMTPIPKWQLNGCFEVRPCGALALDIHAVGGAPGVVNHANAGARNVAAEEGAKRDHIFWGATSGPQ